MSVIRKKEWGGGREEGGGRKGREGVRSRGEGIERLRKGKRQS